MLSGRIVLFICIARFILHNNTLMNTNAPTVDMYNSRSIRLPQKTHISDLAQLVSLSEKIIKESDFYRLLNATISRNASRQVSRNATRVDITLDYPEFTTAEPRFINAKDRMIFWRNADNRRFSGVHKETGVISLIDGGVAGRHLDCGTFTDLRGFEGHDQTNEPTDSHELNGKGLVCPLLVPDGGYFQHFLDGVLPKLVQVYDILQALNMTLLLHGSRDKSVLDMLHHMTIEDHMVSYYMNKHGVVRTDIQMNTCKTPPLHPLLWRRGRRLITRRLTFSHPGFVILITREHTRNGGRKIINVKKVTAFLKQTYHSRLRVFSGNLSFHESLELFSQASVVIGCHGGGLYNIHFSPPDTDVIEFMPVTLLDAPPNGLAHTIFWRVSMALGHRYWRLHARSLDTRNNIYIPLDSLKEVLNQINK